MIRKTPLEEWIRRRVAGDRGGELTRQKLEKYQVEKLKEVIAEVKIHSRFYRNKLEGVAPEDINCLADIQALPFTWPGDLTNDPMAFCCVPQQRISRVMTVHTSGTTGNPKRLFYTEADQEATTDFFHYGMANLADEGDRVLILLPGELPGSVGDLLQKALAGMKAAGIPHGPVEDPLKVLHIMEMEQVNVLVGIPIQVLSLARCEAAQSNPAVQIKSILLSTDYVPGAIVDILQSTWKCKVFNHYGMTETGLGGAVQCDALEGYHMREADLLFEIIDIKTGKPVDDGNYGEIAFTSLTAEGTPLIRYRTGDISRIVAGPCACGTVLKTMEPVRGRVSGRIRLEGGEYIDLTEFDEALFPLEGVLDFQISLTKKKGFECLSICIYRADTSKPLDMSVFYSILEEIPGVWSARKKGALDLNVSVGQDGFNRGVKKRTILDCRNKTI